MTRILPVAAAAVIAASALAATPANATRLDEARSKVTMVLSDLGVDQSRVSSVYLAPQLTGGRSTGAQSYTGWVRFNDCQGALVIDMTSTTHIRSNYTTGSCTVPDMS